MTGATVDSVLGDTASQRRPDARHGDRRSRPGATKGTIAPAQRLHERGDELAEIRYLLGATWEYPTCPIVIEGLAGTGKTALLNATLEIGRDLGLRLGQARCDAAETTASFGVVRQLFSSMFRHRTMPEGPMNDGTDLARRVLHCGLSAADDPVDAYHSLLLLLESTGDEPTLLVIDDIQWADPTSAGWLQFLARRLTTSSVHLVMTSRARRAGLATASDQLISNPSTRRFVMHPLGIESTTSIINQHLRRHVARRVATQAQHVTGGNPLLIARMLTALDDVESTATTITEQHIETLASPIVARTVLAQISTLPAGSLELLEAAVVLGGSDLRVAADLAGLDHDDASRLADVLADVGLFDWGRPLEFVHAFERRSVYAAIKPARRSQLHAHAAQALAGLGADATTVAAHLLASDPNGDEWTVLVLVEGARHCLESGDAERAAELLERADREGAENSLHAEVVRLRAEVEGMLGRHTAVEHLERASRLGLDAVSLAETALDLLDRSRDHSSSAAIFDMVVPASDQLLVHRPQLALRLRLAESVLVPPNERVVHEDTTEQIQGALASSTTGRLLACQEVLRTSARLDCTHEELLAALRPLLTPDVLGCSGLVQTAVLVASLGALVRIGACTTADPMIRSAITEAQATGRRLDASALTLVLAESLAMQGRVLAADQALTGIRLDGDDVISRCAAVQTRYFAALRERGGYAPIRVDGDPDRLRARACRARYVGRDDPDRGHGSSSTARGRHGERSHQLRPTPLGRRTSLRTEPLVRPVASGRAAALAALGRKKEGTAVAAENLQLARVFGSPITIAEALACAARFQPANVQAALLEEAVDLVAGTDRGVAAMQPADRSRFRQT